MLKRFYPLLVNQGLFELVSQGNNMLIVEDLGSKQRCPAYSNDKVISLADIAIFTEEQEVPAQSGLRFYSEEGEWWTGKH